LRILNYSADEVSAGNVERWEVGKRDGWEETENQRTEKYDGTWDTKFARHCGGTRRRGKDNRRGYLYAHFLTLFFERLEEMSQDTAN
jgi:hypothetical protein